MARLVGVDENYSLPPVVLDKLDEDYVSAIVVKGQDIDADGGEDSTGGVQDRLAAASTFGINRLHFPTGRYVIDSISITSSVKITTDPDTFFVRKAGADAASGSYWSAGAAMFEVDAPGLTVTVDGPFTYDGNATNQTTTEPTGFFLKVYPTTEVTGDPTTVRIAGGTFTNGTSGYLLLRGDNHLRRYEARVALYDCTFTDTVYGIGKGDPSTPNPLGYLPTYVNALDYVTLVTLNFKATWDKPLALGQYAACAINGTFYGTDYNLSGEPSVHMYGRTYLRGLGRSGKKWDNATDYLTNNGIGCIDMYGNADTLFVENVVAVDCQNVPVRAKGSLKNYTVIAASLTNCHRGLQVSPSTTGPCETVVTVGSVHTVGGTIPQIEFTGTSTADRIPSVTLNGVDITGTLTNPEALTTEGAVHLRNVQWLDGSGVQVHHSPGRGISWIDVEDGTLNGVRINGTSQQGIFGSGTGTFDLSHFDVTNTGGDGISIAGAPRKIVLRDGRVSGATTNGVFLNNTCPDALTENVAVDNVVGTGGPGTGRAFYAGAGTMAFVSNRVGSAVGTAIGSHTTARIREDHNSWNPTVRWGSAYITTIGSAQRGDQVWNPTPSAGGPAGWVCVVAGSPGTWVPLNLAAA